MEDLLKHHIKECDRRFSELGSDIKEVSNKLTDLQEMKISLMVSSRWVSLLVSVFCGAVTLAATLAVTIYVGK